MDKPAPKSADSLFEAAQRLAAIVESSDDAIIGKDLNGIIQSWNRGAERIFGYKAEEAIGKPITIVIPVELHDQEPMILGKIARGERIDRFETIRQRKDGSQIFMSLTVSPIRDTKGNIVGASKIGRDISDLKQSQERQTLLLHEMNHRIKNLFAIASGVVALSARQSATPKELASGIQARLVALARAHELILPENASHDTMLGDLIKIILRPYDNREGRLVISGPEIALSAPISTSLALLFHEFATNSVKYGALSQHNGRIRIAWLADDTLRFTWREEGGEQAITGENSPGFGSFLIEATVKSLGAQFRSLRDDGDLIFELDIPRDRLSR